MKSTTLASLIIAGSLAFTSCKDRTEVVHIGDITGDSIPDLIINAHPPMQVPAETYLFIGQKNKPYIKAKKTQDSWNSDGPIYYQTADGRNYFFDGKAYREAPQKK